MVQLRYKGSCHCGRVKFEVEGELNQAAVCNCTICHMSGFVHWVIEPSRLRMITPMDELSAYIWGTKAARHYFCSVCSISPLRKPRYFPGKLSVNVRCLEGVDMNTILISQSEGQKHPL
jgi:hypothetical protein